MFISLEIIPKDLGVCVESTVHVKVNLYEAVGIQTIYRYSCAKSYSLMTVDTGRGFIACCGSRMMFNPYICDVAFVFQSAVISWMEAKLTALRLSVANSSEAKR